MYLTALEIKNLAEYALGITISHDELAIERSELDEHEFYIKRDVMVRDDNGCVKHYRTVVECEGCDPNECIPISGE